MKEFDAELDKLLNDGAGNVYITFKARNVAAQDISDGPLEIRVQKKRNRRSLNANAYFHVLVGEIARVLGTSDTEIKRQIVFDYGVIKEQNGEKVVKAMPQSLDPYEEETYPKWISDFISPKGVPMSQYIIYKPTHTLNSAEMAQLIDGVVYEAKELGIETKTPAELAEMKALWKTQKE